LGIVPTASGIQPAAFDLPRPSLGALNDHLTLHECHGPLAVGVPQRVA